MNEILPGVRHWSTHHATIGQPVHSCWLVDEGVVIDPRVPDGGLDAFGDAPPTHALLTNRHHYRHAGRFRERYGTIVLCHETGMHEFTAGEEVEPFEFSRVFGGVKAVEFGAICPEETAYHLDREGGVLAVGDAVIRWGDDLGFVPDQYLGDDPESVKAAIREAARRLLDLEWRHLLLAHGEPFVGDGKERLRAFVEAG